MLDLTLILAKEKTSHQNPAKAPDTDTSTSFSSFPWYFKALPPFPLLPLPYSSFFFSHTKLEQRPFLYHPTLPPEPLPSSDTGFPPFDCTYSPPFTYTVKMVAGAPGSNSRGRGGKFRKFTRGGMPI